METIDLRGKWPESLSPEIIEFLKERARLSRGDILKMTTLAGSGHPGGSMSSIDILTLLYAVMKHSPAEPGKNGDDTVVISNGHISPAVYSALARAGYFSIDDAIAGFRHAGTIFSGHVETAVPGVMWNTGNLGQGLSAACAFAYDKKLRKDEGTVFVLMGDGEQQKGQLAEARDLANKLNLSNLVALIDLNKLQICGETCKVMPQNLTSIYRASGWEVLACDGHDFQELYSTIKKARSFQKPSVILASTVMGRGVSFMENKHVYHGLPLNKEELSRALAELGIENDIERFVAKRKTLSLEKPSIHHTYPFPEIKTGDRIVYPVSEKVAPRNAYGKALASIARENNKNELKIIGIDCDLAGSTKLDALDALGDGSYLQLGIQEHNAHAFAGALSTRGYSVFFSTFGVFAIAETYNQARLNDLNSTHLKVVATHTGTDVGEDGMTHHSIDYIGLVRNLFGFKAIVPADANETDAAIRFIARSPGNYFVALPRSSCPVISKNNGSPAFDKDYHFEYGKYTLLKEGSDVFIFAMGPMVYRAMEVAEILAKKGISAGVVNASSPLSVDSEILKKAIRTGLVISYEDHHVGTGLGASLALAMADTGSAARLVRFGLKNYSASGPASDLLIQNRLHPEHVAEMVAKCVETRMKGSN